jgi:spermine oxidase
VSASSDQEYWDCDGHKHWNWKDQGYRKLFDFLMVIIELILVSISNNCFLKFQEKLPDPSKDLEAEKYIQVSKEVTNIQWDYDNEVPIKITCSDGSTYKADHVIVTVSLGVLKSQHKTLFTPQLPARKQNLIEGLSFGAVGKIFLEFQEPFWPEEWPGLGMIWTREDYDQLKESRDSWLAGLSGFWRVSYQPNILAGFITGSSVKAMEVLGDQELWNGVRFIFDRFLSHHLNYTIPTGILTSKWFTNPHFRGGYSSRTLKTDELEASADNLAAPLTDCSKTPRILFAGEATHGHYFSTVHGAVESGYREAGRLIKYHSDSQTMCRGTVLCRKEIQNVPKNFNLTKATFNFSLFRTRK